MNSIDREYYILEHARSAAPVRPHAFHETRERDYRNLPCAPDSPPLAFFNGSRKSNRQQGIPALPEPPRVMLDGVNLLVRKPVHDALAARGITGLRAQPAWYVHDDKSLHDDYCYLSFEGTFDCWDRELSDYDRDDDAGSLGASVYTFSLDAQLLARTPLPQRLLFVMGGCFAPPLVCHESLLPLFQDDGNSGVSAVALPEA
ncbi:hypothetical protein [Pseudoduganella sp.]|uniref:hypothetical protein n=1 Tax=Pseudoduganella sp. TaxID=1880898 RepID=UPI0035B44ACC